MTPSPTVSVVTACYNADAYLSEAVESVLAQTLGDWELILLDDGSDDETGDIIARHAAGDRRIRPVSMGRSGAIACWNEGVSRARAPWIARLDADDVALPQRLERQLEVAAEEPSTVLVGSGCVEIDRSGNEMARHGYATEHGALVERAERMMAFFPHSSYLYRRDAALELGVYRARFVRAQDVDLALRLSEEGTIRAHPDPLVKVRRHPSAMSNAEAGRLQYRMAVAAPVCHLRRVAGLSDPCEGTADGWERFLAWLDARLEESGEYDRFDAWHALKADVDTDDGPRRGPRLLASALRSPGLLSRRVNMRLRGTSVPARLAKAYDPEQAAGALG